MTKTRNWYRSIEAQHNATEWSSVYRDSTLAETDANASETHAMALCTSMLSLGDVLEGIACTGLLLGDITRGLADATSGYSDVTAYFRESATGRTVVATIPGVSEHSRAYGGQDSATEVGLYEAIESPNDQIRLSAAFLRSVGDKEGVFVHDGYYIEHTKFVNDPPLDWHQVTVQKIRCLRGYYSDPASLACKQCDFPKTSEGGAVEVCSCGTGYYENGVGDCSVCPAGADCADLGAPAKLSSQPDRAG